MRMHFISLKSVAFSSSKICCCLCQRRVQNVYTNEKKSNIVNPIQVGMENNSIERVGCSWVSREQSCIEIRKNSIKFLWPSELKKSNDKNGVIAKPMCGGTFMIFQTATHLYLSCWTNWIFSPEKRIYYNKIIVTCDR